MLMEAVRGCGKRLDGGFGLWLAYAVPSTANNPGQNKPFKAGDIHFEEALKKLETIVELMETEDLPLETLLAKYEEGTQLARTCQEKLTEAELKIQQLEKNAAGEIKFRAVSPEVSE
jgi:exodeoxyribonuclease VII small subunit